MFEVFVFCTVVGLVLGGFALWFLNACINWQKHRLDDLSVLVDQAHARLKVAGETMNNHLYYHELPEAYVDVISGKLQKSTDDAACWDLFSAKDTIVYPGESQVIPTGLVTEMEGCDALIFDRSGLAAKFRITRRAGVIDEKYPGEWGVVLVNEGRYEYSVKKGDRIAQVMFVPKSEVEVGVRVDGTGEVIVNDQARVGGFGSTDVPPGSLD